MADLLASHPVTRPLGPGRFGAPVADPLTLVRRAAAVATVVAGRGRAAEVAGLAAAAFGGPIEDRSAAISAGDLRFVGIGPGRWLVTAAGEGDALAARLEAALAPAASVVDQTGGLVFFVLEGAASVDVMAKLAAIDLDPTVFPVGSAATTSLAHVGATFWREGEACWVFAVGASLALAFERTVVATALAHGIALG